MTLFYFRILKYSIPPKQGIKNADWFWNANFEYLEKLDKTSFDEPILVPFYYKF